MISKLTVSNLCWKITDSLEVLEFLKNNGIQYIEVAPSKIPGFKTLKDLSFAISYKNKLLADYNIRVISIQSIFYNSNLEIFNPSFQKDVILHFTDVFEFAKAIGSNVVVLGSPNNRNLKNNQEIKDTLHIIKLISRLSKSYGVKLLIEANPTFYNSNFITNNYQAYNYIKKFNIENLYINLDLGSVKANFEELNKMDDGFFKLVKHVHISEPSLKLIQKNQLLVQHIKIITDHGFRGNFSLECSEVDLNSIKSMILNMKEIISF